MTRRPAAAPLLVLILLASWALTGVPAATSGPAGSVSVPRSWHISARGPRGGVLYRVQIARSREASAVYVPGQAAAGRRLPLVVMMPDSRLSAPILARRLGVVGLADQLSWDGTVPPFVLVMPARGSRVRDAIAFADAHLPVDLSADTRVIGGIGDAAGATIAQGLRSPALAGTLISLGDRVHAQRVAAATRPASVIARQNVATLQRDHTRVVAAIASGDRAALRRARTLGRALRSLAVVHRFTVQPGIPGITTWHRQLFAALSYALTPARVHAAIAQARGALPRPWAQILAGPAGGTVWQGVIPNRTIPQARRVTLVYLPPSFNPARRYPVMYLLHGLPGSPYSFIGGVRFAATADRLIANRRTKPFIAVMPPAGATIAFNGEWTGPWERFVLHDVVHFVDDHLPTVHGPTGRAIAGLSAGGYGAINIGLRHPRFFNTLESWSGSFTAPRDGSLSNGTPAQRAANDPTTLVVRDLAHLRALGTRMYLTAGLQDRRALAETRAFARLLTTLKLPHHVSLSPGGHKGRFWRTSLAGALVYAFGPRTAGKA